MMRGRKTIVSNLNATINYVHYFKYVFVDLKCYSEWWHVGFDCSVFEFANCSSIHTRNDLWNVKLVKRIIIFIDIGNTVKWAMNYCVRSLFIILYLILNTLSLSRKKTNWITNSHAYSVLLREALGDIFSSIIFLPVQ